MNIPETNRRRAFAIIDVQDAFLTDRNRFVVDNIPAVLKQVHYDLYVGVTFFAPSGTLWETQQQWTMDGKQDDVSLAPAIRRALDDSTSPVEYITKRTRSAFKGTPRLQDLLKRHDIAELHIAGISTHDCVLATAHEAFDLGYPVYVLEECCQSVTPGRHEEGIAILRYQNMTNNSCLADVSPLPLE